MLPRAERIGTSAFAIAFSKGRTVRHPLLHLRFYRRGDGKGSTRAAFVAAKKLGKATLRNRIRRRVREQYRKNTARQDERLQGCDLIFIATAAAVPATSAQLDEATTQVLRRAAKLAVDQG